MVFMAKWIDNGKLFYLFKLVLERNISKKFEILKSKFETKRFGKLKILNSKHEIKPKKHENKHEKSETRNRNRTIN